jgi:hypothetical protein
LHPVVVGHRQPQIPKDGNALWPASGAVLEKGLSPP